jgi:hypothetical protein
MSYQLKSFWKTFSVSTTSPRFVVEWFKRTDSFCSTSSSTDHTWASFRAPVSLSERSGAELLITISWLRFPSGNVYLVVLSKQRKRSNSSIIVQYWYLRILWFSHRPFLFLVTRRQDLGLPDRGMLRNWRDICNLVMKSKKRTTQDTWFYNYPLSIGSSLDCTSGMSWYFHGPAFGKLVPHLF